MRSTAFGLLMMAVAAAGCATAHDTPAQDLSWERWRACDHFATISLDRIDADGRLVVNGQQSEAAQFTACVHEAEAAQARRGVSAGPPAAVFVKLYGCMGGAM